MYVCMCVHVMMLRACVCVCVCVCVYRCEVCDARCYCEEVGFGVWGV